MQTTSRFTVRLLTLAFLLAAICVAQGNRKRPLTHQDYDTWRSIQSQQLSPDGKFVAYGLFPQEGDGEVVVRNLASGHERREPAGALPPPAAGSRENPEEEPERRNITLSFSPDSRHLAFLTFPSKAARDKARQERRQPDELYGDLVIMDLAGGQPVRISNVRSFQLAAKAAGWIAYWRGPQRPGAEQPRPEAAPQNVPPSSARGRRGARPEYGSDLVLRNLKTGAERVFPDVIEYSLSKDAKTLVYAVSSRQHPDTNGVYRVGAEGPPSALLSGKGRYTNLTWDQNQTQLVFLSNRETAGALNWKICHWDGKSATTAELISPQTPGFPQGLALADRASLSFSRDGGRLFFGVAPPRPASERNSEAASGDPVTLDLWHWLDDYIQPMQKARAERDRNRSYRGAYHLAEKKLVQIADPAMAEVTLSDDGRWAIGSDDREYRRVVEHDQRYADLYLVNTISGRRNLLAKKSRGSATWSPDSRHAVFFDGRHWNSIAVPGGRILNLTARLGVSFWNESDDRPGADRPYGTAGFTSDGKWVLLYDRYDVWQVSPDGGVAKMLTDGVGRKEKLEFRYARGGEGRGFGERSAEPDRDERGIDPAKPLLLRAGHELSHDTGFYRDSIDGAAPPERLLMASKYFSSPARAKEAEVYLLTASTFSEFPDLLVAEGAFCDLRKVSQANPQQSGLLWGSSELISYTNLDGVPLQAVLFKPENFDRAKKYPMIVYIYERLSGRLHRFVNPAPGGSINAAYYASNGYLVLMPDIVYTVGYPGPSALKCVLPAMQAVVDQGFVDDKAIGIQGHSWGGYQIAYMITQTNRFRAAAAGAPVADMISAYNGIRWGPGLPRQFQYERAQSRIGGSLWEYPTRFILNSPVFQADRVTTPLMILHNDNDDAVPWYQGIELYLSLRRLGKEVYLFNYNGEPHGIRRRANQKDYTIRMQQFFDHYLKGAPKPEWMERGVPYLEREAEKLRLKSGTNGGP